jgi:hypothetical protein
MKIDLLKHLQVYDNIKMLLLINGFGVDLVHLFKGQFRAVVNTIMNLRCQLLGNYNFSLLENRNQRLIYV